MSVSFLVLATQEADRCLSRGWRLSVTSVSPRICLLYAVSSVVPYLPSHRLSPFVHNSVNCSPLICRVFCTLIALRQNDSSLHLLWCSKSHESTFGVERLSAYTETYTSCRSSRRYPESPNSRGLRNTRQLRSTRAYDVLPAVLRRPAASVQQGHLT